MERVAKLGQMGDLVDVKPGFARNYLLPQGKALTASKSNIDSFKALKKKQRIFVHAWMGKFLLLFDLLRTLAPFTVQLLQGTQLKLPQLAALN